MLANLFTELSNAKANGKTIRHVLYADGGYTAG